jgi:hypothetical protein
VHFAGGRLSDIEPAMLEELARRLASTTVRPVLAFMLTTAQASVDFLLDFHEYIVICDGYKVVRENVAHDEITIFFAARCDQFRAKRAEVSFTVNVQDAKRSVRQIVTRLA